MEIPNSPFFQPVDLSDHFNTARTALPDALKTPRILDQHYGTNTFRGMPFLLGPEDGPNVVALSNDAIEIPLDGATATYVVILHVAEDRVTNYADGLADFQVDGNEIGHHVADYALRFADGTEVAQSIHRRFAVQQARHQWGASPFAAVPAQWDDVVPGNADQIALGRNDVPIFGRGECRVRSAHDFGPDGQAWLYAMPNPHPEKVIRSLHLAPATEQSVVYGICLARVEEHPLRTHVRSKVLLTLPEDVKFNAIGELDNVTIDLGTVISARQQFLYDHERWSSADPDLQPEPSETEAVIEYAAHPQARLYVKAADGELISHDLATTNGGPMISVAPATHKVRIHVLDKQSGRPALDSLCVAAGPQSNIRKSLSNSRTKQVPNRAGVGVGVPAQRI